MKNNFFYMGLGGGANSSLHPPFRRKGGAPAPLHPPLATGLRGGVQKSFSRTDPILLWDITWPQGRFMNDKNFKKCVLKVFNYNTQQSPFEYIMKQNPFSWHRKSRLTSAKMCSSSGCSFRESLVIHTHTHICIGEKKRKEMWCSNPNIHVCFLLYII